ncbi:TfoX/Sxy family protein [Microbacterium sp.]|uniref:TfoX/Sxy family protein n=1 Tax=Microbacterium sp. TaxID=51671 RepID=UPI003A86A1B7
MVASSKGVAAPPPVRHDLELYEQLAEHVEALAPDVTRRRMFGSPALCVGRKMAVCVFGDAMGMRVPQPLAAEALESGRALPFQPHGKSRMREWVMITGGEDAIEPNSDLILAAVDYARANNV